MIIKTSKPKGFTLVPEGRQIVHVDSVKLVPSGKPQMVEFIYSHESGGIIKETLKFDHPVALDILGKRCDIAMGGLPEDTEIQTDELESIFNGKTFEVEVKHTEGKSGGTFANIKYMVKLISSEDDDL